MDFPSQCRNKRGRDGEKKEIVEKSQVVDRSYNISQDIIDEILARLPVKSLIRFKAVSKLCHSTISNPTFQIRRPATRIFAMVESCGHLLFHSIDKKGKIDEFRLPAWCNLEYSELKRRAVISNSCNGMLLLCLDMHIFLLNPSTHYIEKVLTLDEWPYGDKRYFLGFCYDESIGDYKAILIPTFSTLNYAPAIVACLKEKEWKTLHIPMNIHRMTPGPLFKDRLHATIRDTRLGLIKPIINNQIVYFNPIEDVFENVACPKPKSGNEDDIVGLGVLEDCLCMARRIRKEFYGGDK